MQSVGADFMLSPEGQRLVEETGYVSLGMEAVGETAPVEAAAASLELAVPGQ